MQIVNLIATGLPIALAVVMIGAGGVIIMAAATATLIRFQEWKHLPPALILTTIAAVIAIRTGFGS